MTPPGAAEFADNGRCFLSNGSRWAAVSLGVLFRKEHDSISASTDTCQRMEAWQIIERLTS